MEASNYIIVSGPSEEALEAATQLLADLYADTGFTQGVNILKSRKVANSYVVEFASSPDFRHFKYFVNYLRYPELDGYESKVIGYYSLKEEERVSIGFEGTRIMIYVSDRDTEGDNVNAIAEGGSQTVKFGFSFGEEYRKLEHNELEFAEPVISSSDFESLATIWGDVNYQKDSANGCLGMATWLVITAAILLLI